MRRRSNEAKIRYMAVAVAIALLGCPHSTDAANKCAPSSETLRAPPERNTTTPNCLTSQGLSVGVL